MVVFVAVDFDFLKDRYDFELERKDKLTSAVSLPSGFLTALGGLMGLMARTFTFDDPVLNVTFVGLLFCGVASFVVSLVNLAGAYHGQDYEYLPRLGELRDAHGELRSYYLEAGGDDSEVEADFRDSLERRIIEAADRNAKSNDQRTAFMHRANIALFVVLVTTATAGLPYVVDQARKNLMSKQPSAQSEKPAADQRPTQHAPAPTKPEFPQNRVLKEGQMPKR